jgi:hypothetical protein
MMKFIWGMGWYNVESLEGLNWRWTLDEFEILLENNESEYLSLEFKMEFPGKFITTLINKEDVKVVGEDVFKNKENIIVIPINNIKKIEFKCDSFVPSREILKLR